MVIYFWKLVISSSIYLLEYFLKKKNLTKKLMDNQLILLLTHLYMYQNCQMLFINETQRVKWQKSRISFNNIYMCVYHA